jgi:hypothetical protein
MISQAGGIVAEALSINEPRAAVAKAQNQLRDDELRAGAALFVAARGRAV